MKTIIIFSALLIYPLSLSFGQNWSIQETGQTQQINAITFTSASTGYCAGPEGRFFKTTNGGLIWSPIITNFGGQVFDISFPSASTGYAGGVSGRLMKTTNAGLNWTELATGYPQIYSVHFTDVSTGYILAQSTQNPAYSTIAKTTNGGSDWNAEYHAGLRMYKIRNTENNPAELYACGSAGLILKSTDYGDHWQPLTVIYGGIFRDIDPFNPSSIVAAAENSVYRSTNSGANWEWLQQNPPTTFYDVCMVSNVTGYAAGTFGHIFKTYNSGLNWYMLDYNDNNITFTSAFFTSAMTGYFGRSDGRITKTTNGGGQPIGIQPVGTQVPGEYNLMQNYPNPFNPPDKYQVLNPKRRSGNVKRI